MGYVIIVEAARGMHGVREWMARRLLSISVTHTLDSLEIKQRHAAISPTATSSTATSPATEPPHTAWDRCGEMVLVADLVSKVSFWLAVKVAPPEFDRHLPAG